MQISQKGILELIAHEAVILNRYRDTKGVWTIGVGVTDSAGADIKPSEFNGEITVQQAYDMLLNLLPQYEGFVRKLLINSGNPPIKQHEYDALVSLAWNVGSILTLKNQTVGTRKFIAHGNVAGAIDLWRADRELKRRRDKEVDLAKTGEYKSRTALVANAGEYGEVLWGDAKRVPLSSFTGGGGSW